MHRCRDVVCRPAGLPSVVDGVGNAPGAGGVKVGQDAVFPDERVVLTWVGEQRVPDDLALFVQVEGMACATQATQVLDHVSMSRR